MNRIAISYRRDDSAAITGRIFDRLVARYGADTVFRDVDNIPLGVDFRDHISSILSQTDITLVVVGKRWFGPLPRRRRRIDDPADPVRVEVETALRNGMPVVPILVEGGTMPNVDQLPDSLKEFVYRNGLDVDAGRDFDQHIERLIRIIDGAPRIRERTEEATAHPTEATDELAIRDAVPREAPQGEPQAGSQPNRGVAPEPLHARKTQQHLPSTPKLGPEEITKGRLPLFGVGGAAVAIIVAVAFAAIVYALLPSERHTARTPVATHSAASGPSPYFLDNHPSANQIMQRYDETARRAIEKMND